jgi:hypothetical protein
MKTITKVTLGVAVAALVLGSIFLSIGSKENTVSSPVSSPIATIPVQEVPPSLPGNNVEWSRFIPLGILIALVLIGCVFLSFGKIGGLLAGALLIAISVFLGFKNPHWIDMGVRGLDYLSKSQGEQRSLTIKTEGDIFSKPKKPDPIVVMVTKKKIGPEWFCFQEVTPGVYYVTVSDGQTTSYYKKNRRITELVSSVAAHWGFSFNEVGIPINIFEKRGVRFIENKKDGAGGCMQFGFNARPIIISSDDIDPTDIIMTITPQ